MERPTEELWVPDNPDGSGWAEVDWVSAVREPLFLSPRIAA